MFLNGASGSEREAGVNTYSFSKDAETSISTNFKVKEFRCKDGSDKILVDADFVRDKLQAIRNHFGVPITINYSVGSCTIEIEILTLS